MTLTHSPLGLVTGNAGQALLKIYSATLIAPSVFSPSQQTPGFLS